MLFDNVHYDEQLECYKQCLSEDGSFRAVLEHDLVELKKRLPNVLDKEKREKVTAFVERLKNLCDRL